MQIGSFFRVAVPAVLAIGAVGFAGHRAINAADHFDPPGRVGTDISTAGLDVAADIADLYAFYDASNVYLTIGFGGPSSPTLPAFYDRDVLYTFHVSNAGARTDTEFPIEVRFSSEGNEAGIEVRNLPGGGSIQGPVESTLTTNNGIRIRAGLFDDPFAFDPQGLRDTRSTGNLSFNRNRNPFGMRNTTFVIIAIPRPLIDRGQPLDIWSSSARIRGS